MAAITRAVFAASIAFNGDALAVMQHQTIAATEEPQDCMAPGELLFLHVMKNGGTSVDHFLACKAKRNIAGFKLSLGTFEAYEGDKKCKEPTVCSTHGEWRNRVELCGAAFKKPSKAFTVMREPVDRVWSMYNYQKSKEYEESGTMFPPVDEMISDCLHGKGYEFMCQAMMNHVTIETLATNDDLIYNVSSCPECVEQAKGVMDKLDAIMLMDDFETFTEAFDHSNIFSDKHEPTTFDEDCDLEHANPTECKVCDDEPTDDQRKVIEENNQMDIELYEYAKKIKTRYVK